MSGGGKEPLTRRHVYTGGKSVKRVQSAVSWMLAITRPADYTITLAKGSLIIKSFPGSRTRPSLNQITLLSAKPGAINFPDSGYHLI
ncbi:hypothetical protein J6590_079535 [Homalodisca vitripennis]|nr:hypothetical protein J6590_079535 [Homalodisca vitripennis]